MTGFLSQYARMGFTEAQRGRTHNPWPEETYEHREFAKGQAAHAEAIDRHAEASRYEGLTPAQRFASGYGPRVEPDNADFIRLALRFAQCRQSKAKAQAEEGLRLQRDIEARFPGLALWLFYEAEPYPEAEDEETT